ncbi:MAG: aminotransferase class IV, partial [Acidobacteriota bacterium]
MQGVVYVNGTITSADAAVVPVFDHGFLYGEGIYETLRTYGRVPFLFSEHMARLRRSAELIALPVPFTDAELRAEIDRTCAACEVADT